MNVNNPTAGEAAAAAAATSNGGMARVQFRVRCESLGHGEAVYLVPQDGPNGNGAVAAPLLPLAGGRNAGGSPRVGDTPTRASSTCAHSPGPIIREIQGE